MTPRIGGWERVLKQDPFRSGEWARLSHSPLIPASVAASDRTSCSRDPIAKLLNVTPRRYRLPAMTSNDSDGSLPINPTRCAALACTGRALPHRPFSDGEAKGFTLSRAHQRITPTDTNVAVFFGIRSVF